eukprot:TRINITY_DN16153_c0_g1_i2.p1 TRINITY_DN16153_c0_g1~~TRINITY_DN16153_c0_g1_i2.p1  ORF type:complete len:250 (-),score=35.25 TRINITY_DN16153_c0_g1_i2:142-891(-)
MLVEEAMAGSMEVLPLAFHVLLRSSHRVTVRRHLLQRRHRCHRHLEHQHRHTTPRGLITMRNAFVQEEAPRPNESEPAKFIYSVNRSSQELYDDVFRLASKVGAERLALDKAMAGYKQKLQNECADYMRHRSEIYTLAGRHCGAAQGRLQAAEVDDANGPRGCLHTPPSGTGVEHGTPYQLPEQRCTHSERQLLCTTRLKELSRGAPAPGEAPDAPSMDAQVRKWCHPAQVVETPRVTRDLAMGMPETS